VEFKYLGKNTMISPKASFYRPENISIGDNTRIDDFCVISAGEGGIEIGRNVHISTYCFLVGKGKITLSDFSSISSRTNIFSSADDTSGEFMIGPTLPKKYLNVKNADVFLGKHVNVGTGAVILPGAVLGEGCVVGALSLVKGECEPFKVYAGIPVRFIKDRSRKVLELEKEFLSE